MHSINQCPVCQNKNLITSKTIVDYAVSREQFTIFECSDCSLLATRPRPDDSDLGKYYLSDDYVSHTGRAKSLINKLLLVARRYTLRQKIRIVAQNSPSGKLLDVGCGTGHFLRVAINNGITTYGIEPSEIARKIAIKDGISVYPTIDLCEDINFASITLWHVLEHLPNPLQFLQTLSDKLMPDGTIFIAVPNYKSYDSKHYQEYWAGYDVPRHLYHFSQKSMKKLIQVAGLRLEKTIPMKLDSYYVSLLSEKYLANGKLNLLGLARGALIGLRSNQSARRSGEYSSIIYVVRK